ncbi:MAG TPA: outer membrane beta-barrel protein [Candidatus Cybelea sp.]|nr:outer membrane beta-barrel protein [Candidatus Cybelea sp.]
MKIRVVVSCLALATVFGLSGKAQELPKIDASASYSYFRANPATPGFGNYSLNGGSASASYNVRDWLSGVADFGGYSVGRADGVNVNNHMLTYLFGPRFTYRQYRRFSPYGHVLVGAARAGSNVFATTNSHTALATAFGVGVDWNVRDRFSIRPLQFDYLLTHLPEVTNGNTQTQNNIRVSTGIVFHFK